jgi:hypothetical protein
MSMLFKQKLLEVVTYMYTERRSQRTAHFCQDPTKTPSFY